MFLFIAILTKGFSLVGQSLQPGADLSVESRFMIWALGCSLFAHAATFMSVSYFDQSVVFLYLTLAVVASNWSATVIPTKEENTVEIELPAFSAISSSSHAL